MIWEILDFLSIVCFANVEDLDRMLPCLIFLPYFDGGMEMIRYGVNFYGVNLYMFRKQGSGIGMHTDCILEYLGKVRRIQGNQHEIATGDWRIACKSIRKSNKRPNLLLLLHLLMIDYSTTAHVERGQWFIG